MVSASERRRGPGGLWRVLAAAAVILSAAGVPAASADGEAELEEFIRKARVVEAREIGSGITRPLRLLLEHEGRTLTVAFKTVQVYRHMKRRKPGFPIEQEFTDDYHYERAAYLLDRELGLHMVPLVVLRKWHGRPGAAIVWVTDAIDELERRERDLEPPDPQELERQRAVMRVFDALILNTDRHLTNQLITTADWKLHLIDHSRAFRVSHELPDRFLQVPARLPRELVPRLEALEEKRLAKLLRGVIGQRRVRSLLARRDKILEKIELDRQRFGDPFVFRYEPADAGGS